MSKRLRTRAMRRLETRLWTGAAGHLIGGAADFIEALARYALARFRPRRARTARTTARRRAGG